VIGPHSSASLLALWLIALLTALACALGRRHRHSPWRPRLEHALAWLNLLLWLGFVGYGLLPSRFTPARSLPLHLSDLLIPLASLSLLTQIRPFRALLYFWGLGLGSQALLTPALGFGPDSFWFWLFWLQHGAIVGTAVYLLAAHGFRPGWGDFRWAAGAALADAALIAPLDALLGFNYGFLGRGLPSRPSLLDHLGPWPWRPLLMSALGLLALLLLQLPWLLARRASRNGGPPRTGCSRVRRRRSRSDRGRG